jgi:hypothetical protein
MKGILIVTLVLFQSLNFVLVLRIWSSSLEVGIVVLEVGVRVLLIVSDHLLHVVMRPLSRYLERLILFGNIHIEGSVSRLRVPIPFLCLCLDLWG